LVYLKLVKEKTPERPPIILVSPQVAQAGFMNKSSEEASQRSVEYQPSETAMATATLPAMAAHDEREEIRRPRCLSGKHALRRLLDSQGVWWDPI
jgi:hypothetical protein